jgi:iron-sulfur cluster insertion protein
MVAVARVFNTRFLSKMGVSLVIDPMSYQYLAGSEVDFTEELEGAMFVVKNPNATSTCGCGASFSI